jgi:hypothetical protein
MKVLMTATIACPKPRDKKIEFGTQANQWLPCKELRILSTSVVTCAIQSTLAETLYKKRDSISLCKDDEPHNNPYGLKYASKHQKNSLKSS